MTRRHLLEKLSRAELSLDEVWDWYEFQAALINAELERTLDALFIGLPLDQPCYFSKTRDQLIEFFGKQRSELARAAMLSLLSATEAAVRVDYIERVAKKRKDVISRGFTKLYVRFKLNVSLQDQILDL